MSLFRIFITVLVGCVLVSNGSAEEGSLSFTDQGKGYFGFNTGFVKGTIYANDKNQSLNSLIDIDSGMELAHGGDYPGLYSPYRVFSDGKRYGDAMRDWPLQATILTDGALQIRWPSQEETPFEIVTISRWRSPHVMDYEIAVTPMADVHDFELFLSSYFHENLKSLVYVRPTVHNGGQPQFIAADANPLLEGTYLAFPRDRKAARTIFDGRWDMGHNPVDFSIPRFYALPIAMRKDTDHGITVVQMSCPEDCFAIETPYNKEPADGIASHGSIYFSFFGRDIRAGETTRVRNRMLIGINLSTEEILQEYQRFNREPH